jgi:hypothetical protein
MAGLALALGLSLLAGSALASEIYRYTDEEGNVHFTDRPPGNAEAERVAIASRPTNNAAVRRRYDSQFGESDRAEAPPEKAAEDEAEEPKTRNDYLVEAEERAERCAEYREKYEILEAARRVYSEDEGTGERVYFDDSQVSEARAEARELVAQYCD